MGVSSGPKAQSTRGGWRQTGAPLVNLLRKVDLCREDVLVLSEGKRQGCRRRSLKEKKGVSPVKETVQREKERLKRLRHKGGNQLSRRTGKTTEAELDGKPRGKGNQSKT